MTTDRWYCPRCGRDGFAAGYSQRSHARHCTPPEPIALHVGSPRWRYYWHLQMWRANSGRLSAAEAMVVRLAFARAQYELDVVRERCEIGGDAGTDLVLSGAS